MVKHMASSPYSCKHQKYIDLSQEILAIYVLTALKSSLEHRVKHILLLFATIWWRQDLRIPDVERSVIVFTVLRTSGNQAYKNQRIRQQFLKQTFSVRYKNGPIISENW